MIPQGPAQDLLQQVSRSFAFTIPQLPAALRPIVTNAYLLCRIADTIEDEESLTLDQKRLFFREFMDVIDGRLPPEQFARALHPLLSQRTTSAERELVRRTPAVIQFTLTFPDNQQAIIKRCVASMCRGMLRFQELRSPLGLKDVFQLDLYCYHVAGVVGEMLTDLFCDHSPEIARNREKLFALAASFGQGLQMTNILKDLWDDRERGACWLPRDVFQRAGFDMQDLQPGRCPPSFARGLKELIGIARGHLENALSYTLMIPRKEAGIRRFCLWAIGMAVLTLHKMHHRPNYASSQEVKISRRAVHSVTLVSGAALRSNFLLRRIFGLIARDLPQSSSRRVPLRDSAS